MLESSDIHDSDANRAAEAHIHTQDIPFIACGAFSGFKTTVDQRRHNPNIGFAALPGGLMGGEPICERVTEEEILPVANFAAYGMLPELMGRFSRIVPLQPMGMKELLQILSTQVIERYRKELGMAGIHLDIEPGVLERIARECLIRETGARGIASSLGNHLEQACFSVYSLADPAGSVVQVKCNGDRIDVTLETGGETQPLTGKSVATTRA
jgi:ATP-dependent Clp protease ATP-binding subunit ClpX